MLEEAVIQYLMVYLEPFRKIDSLERTNLSFGIVATEDYSGPITRSIQ